MRWVATVPSRPRSRFSRLTGPQGQKVSPRQQRVQDLIEKRREAGHLSMKELTELQRLRRLLSRSVAGQYARRDDARRQDEQRRRGSGRDRERER